MAIVMALIAGSMGSIGIQQAKYANLRRGYNPVDFSIEAGLTCGVIIFLFSTYYYLQGYPTYTLYNIGISFIASTF